MDTSKYFVASATSLNLFCPDQFSFYNISFQYRRNKQVLCQDVVLEHILNLKQIIEKLQEFNKPRYLCFLDYQKAFDQVKWKKTSYMENMGIPHLTTYCPPI